MFKALRQRVAKGLSPLPSPKLLDSGETVLGWMLPPELVSSPVLDFLAVPSIIASGDANGFSHPRDRLAISVDFAKPELVGKGLTDELRLLRIAQPEITAPLDESPVLQHPLAISVDFAKPELVGKGLTDELRLLRIAQPEITAPLDESPVLQHPQLLAPLGGPEIGELPEIVGFFDELSPPQVLGSIYGNRPISSGVAPSSNGKTTHEYRDREWCRHGRRGCGICHRSATSRTPTPRTGRSRVPDVFGRLRFILQPPVLERLNEPDFFADDRRPYLFQVEGVRWLLDHPEGLLADEMGLGKTMQAILAMRVLFNRGELNRVLVVAPASVGATWEQELSLWAPELTAVRVQGDPAQRDAQWRSAAEVQIVSYESLARDMQRPSPVSGIPFELCIADEAQKIKNPDTANSRALRSVSTKCRLRWALTGTPLENTAGDAVSIFRFISPRLQLDPRSPSPRSLRNAISPYLLRRTKRQVDIQLPELRHDVHWLDLSPGQFNAYRDAENSGVKELRALGRNVTRIHILSLITRLKLICNYDEISGQSCKLDFLQGNLDEISANDEKALIFSQYPHKSLAKIANHLQRFKPLTFDGSVNTRQREGIVERFQQQDGNDILLMGIRSGGTGITLTRANHVFHFDHWWNPAIVDQGSARVHRIGQQRSVFIHSLYTRSTIEERIDKILSRKRQLFQDVFGELEDGQVVSRLSDEELFGLFALVPLKAA